MVGEVFLFPLLDRGPNILLEARAITFCNPAPLFCVIDGDEDPGLSISAGGSEGSCLADFSDQLAGDGVGSQTTNRTGGADALEEG